jgi:uncharacterized membrane protein
VKTNAAMLTGMGLGAAAAYLLDPVNGRRRRARARDSMVRAARKSGDAAGATSRDVANRSRGLAAMTRARWEGEGRRPGPRPDTRWAFARESWSPTARLVAGSGGISLLMAGLRRRGLGGALLSAAGALLAARSVTDMEVRRLLGIGAGRRAVDIQKTVTIQAPVADVFAYWLDYENFPRFMSHVREVHPTQVDGQSHWVVDGPGGVPIAFDAVTTDFIPNETIGWRTLEGAAVGHAGHVRFEPVGHDATRVHLRFSYNPPAGAVGHAAAWLLGADAKRLFDDDLLRLKALIETGRPPHDAARPTGSGETNRS